MSGGKSKPAPFHELAALGTTIEEEKLAETVPEGTEIPPAPTHLLRAASVAAAQNIAKLFSEDPLGKSPTASELEYDEDAEAKDERAQTRSRRDSESEASSVTRPKLRASRAQHTTEAPPTTVSSETSVKSTTTKAKFERVPVVADEGFIPPAKGWPYDNNEILSLESISKLLTNISEVTTVLDNTKHLFFQRIKYDITAAKDATRRYIK